MSTTLRIIVPRYETRKTLKQSILEIFPMISYDRIEYLLNDLDSDISLLIEQPYINKHCRDSFYFYHSSKFSDYSRFAARVHIFQGSIRSYNEMMDKRDKYAGYFVIRPLELHPLGRSMISPSIIKQKGFFTCLAKEKYIYLILEELH